MQKTYPLLSACPVCSEELVATKLTCTHCHTTIEGSFSLSKFNYLEKEKLYFIEIFVKNRGNIKAIEKELNLSYPTVKKMLDDAIESLGYNPQEESVVEENVIDKASVISALSDGKIDVKEAIKLLRKEKGEK